MDSKNYILIAGASGFIGKNLVTYLLDKGYSIKVISRNIETTQALFPSDVECISWQQATPEYFNSKTEQCEAIINLAGENIGNQRWTPTNRKQIIDSRIQSINKLAELVKQLNHKPKTWLQASAIGFYGRKVILPMDETGRMGNGFLPYVVDLWEHQAKTKVEKSIRLVRLRFGVVISKNEGFLADLLNRTGRVAFCPGNGKNKISWIHINDLVKAIEFTLNADGIHGAINMVSPKPDCLLEIIRFCGRIQASWFLIKVPLFAIKMILGNHKTKELVVADQHIIPQKLNDLGFKFNYKKLEDLE